MEPGMFLSRYFERPYTKWSDWKFVLIGISLSILCHWAWGHGTAHEGHDPSTFAMDDGYTLSTVQYQLPDIELVDMEGRRESLTRILAPDDPVMLNLIFTTCTAICPVMSATFAQVRHDLGSRRDQLRMISISIDPEHDTPKRLNEYAHKYKADAQWQFYTGARVDIVKLQRSLQAYRGNKMNHIPLTYLRPSATSPWIRIEGFASAQDLINEYQRSLASQH
jgi:protein SCO1/2